MHDNSVVQESVKRGTSRQMSRTYEREKSVANLRKQGRRISKNVEKGVSLTHPLAETDWRMI